MVKVLVKPLSSGDSKSVETVTSEKEAVKKDDFLNLSTVEVLEELLEERTVTDRRVAERVHDPEFERRQSSRRNADDIG